MNTDTPTPETDAVDASRHEVHAAYFIMRSHACKLERERDEWQINALLKLAVKQLGCMWCGELVHAPTGYEPGTPLNAEQRAQAYQQHVATCPAHPIRDVERERNEARKQLNVWKNEAEVVRVELKKADEALENNIETFLDLREQLSAERTLANRLAKALRELRDAEWLTMPGRANDIVEAALTTLNQQEP